MSEGVMFSPVEAVDFLEKSWRLIRVAERLETDRKALLEDIVTTLQVKVAFQSVTFMAIPPAQRVRPSLADIKVACMSGVGGLCYTLNVFVWGLLKSLGICAQLCPATCTSTIASPDNHVVVLVNDLESPGDLHLVEAGVGFPTFRIIALNFKDESPVFRDSFLEYKYVRHEGRLLRMHGAGDTVKRFDPPRPGIDLFLGRWRRFYHLTLRPTDNISDLDASFDEVYTKPGTTSFDTSPRALRFPDRRAVVMVNNSLMKEGEGTEGLVKTQLKDDEEIVKVYAKYFPI